MTDEPYIFPVEGVREAEGELGRCCARLVTSEARKQKVLPPYDQCYRKGKYIIGDNAYCLTHAKILALDIAIKLTEQAEEEEQSAALRHASNMRAINRWQQAHPGKRHIWPDRTDLVVWLMEQLEERDG